MPIRLLGGVQDKVEVLEITKDENFTRLRSYGYAIVLRRLESCGNLVPVERPDLGCCR